MTKPQVDRLAVVTATINPARARHCIASWGEQGAYDFRSIVVWNGALDTTGMSPGERKVYETWSPATDARYANNTILQRPEILGVVPAFAVGVAEALRQGSDIIACFHDDLLIEEPGWDKRVLDWFDLHPQVGLAGFGGGTGLGDADIYQKPYEAHQLARQGFVSNMRDAEAHGVRHHFPLPVACLDGFSQIGRAEYWRGERTTDWIASAGEKPGTCNLFEQMAKWGITHHAYDAALGCFAKRLGWSTWMLPVACHHLGGQTAVGEPRYQQWAEEIVPGGDRTFWELAHKEVYERFRDVLPIRS